MENESKAQPSDWKKKWGRKFGTGDFYGHVDVDEVKVFIEQELQAQKDAIVEGLKEKLLTIEKGSPDLERYYAYCGFNIAIKDAIQHIKTL